MKRALALLTVAVAAAAASVSAAGGSPSALLAAVGEGSSARLAAVDPLTLAPIGRSTQIGRYTSRWARSPDGTQLVLARDDRASLRVVDLRRMKTLRAFWVGGGTIDALAWLEPRLLVAVVDGFVAVGADPVSKRVRWRRYLPSQLEAIERTASGFAVLVRAGDSPATGLGPTELVAIGAGGSLRTAVLDRIRSGLPDYTQSPPSTEYRQPGLAVDAAGGKAYVVGADEPVAEVDLATMAVTYHGGSRTLAKAVSGPQRSAVWVGDGLLAVTGTDGHVEAGPSEEHWWVTPAGLSLVDTRDWTWRTIDRDATAVRVAGRLLLASSWVYDSNGPTVTGMGLAAYGLDGTPRFHVLGRSPVDVLTTWGGLVYAVHDGVTVVDPAAGRVVGAAARQDVYPLTDE